jgi:quaternary ammonium compound-resistance protein SugE
MAWVYLLVAGLLEVVWAIGLKYTEGLHPPVAERGHAGGHGA